MTYILKPAEIEKYKRDGFISPIRIFSTEEVTKLKSEVFELGVAREGRLPPALNLKAHLLIPSLWKLVHNQEIVSIVRQLLGDDILCWGSSFFDKLPMSEEYVCWHQDSTYWGLERPDALTVWLALTPSGDDNGCLRVIPKSHDSQLKHIDANNDKNMLLGGEVIETKIEEDCAVSLILEPGEVSIHHQQLIHGSLANQSMNRRMGFAIRYISGKLKGNYEGKSYATLVHGESSSGFELEKAPNGTFDPEAIRRHGTILRRCYGVVKSRKRKHETQY